MSAGRIVAYITKWIMVGLAIMVAEYFTHKAYPLFAFLIPALIDFLGFFSFFPMNLDDNQ